MQQFVLSTQENPRVFCLSWKPGSTMPCVRLSHLELSWSCPSCNSKGPEPLSPFPTTHPWCQQAAQVKALSEGPLRPEGEPRGTGSVK